MLEMYLWSMGFTGWYLFNCWVIAPAPLESFDFEKQVAFLVRWPVWWIVVYALIMAVPILNGIVSCVLTVVSSICVGLSIKANPRFDIGFGGKLSFLNRRLFDDKPSE